MMAFLSAFLTVLLVAPLKTLAATTSSSSSVLTSSSFILQSEFLFAISTVAFLVAAVRKYAGHLAWSLPNSPREGVDLWIGTVVAVGLVLPLGVLAASLALGTVSSSVLLLIFGPYFAQLLLQLSAWRVVGFQQSAAWPLVAIPFTLWRIHQTLRAAALLSAAHVPLLFPALFSYLLAPFWAIDLFLHLLLWPVMYKWPMRDNSLITALVTPKNKPPVDAEEEGWRVLEEIEALKVQRARLEKRARLIQQMQIQGYPNTQTEEQTEEEKNTDGVQYSDQGSKEDTKEDSKEGSKEENTSS